MHMRVAAIIVGLAVAGSPALAQAAKSHKPIAASAAHTAMHKARAKTAKKGKARGKSAPAALIATYAAMPEAERLAIQSDLAWVGDDEGMVGDFDGRTIGAVKAFQQRNNGKATGILTAAERDLLATAAKSRAAGVGWRLIDDTATGARLGLPEKLVPHSGVARAGSRWTSAQGQIQVETFRLTEAALPALFKDEKKAAKRHAAFSVLKPDSFVISGVQGLKNFVVRAQASGSELRGVTVLYDQATEGIMGPVAVAIANTFAGFPDANAAPPPGLRRAVEYGSAIVVGSGGNLIASAAVTDGCQAITVPGLGHAERVAADKTNEVALLRLYGARNLVAATLAGANSQPGDLTLVGVADPLSQAGGGAVTSVAARRTAQGIEPAPKLGFSGAAAVDAQGRLAGMVDLKPPVVAGAGSAGQQATLVPVETIRTFLQAHGITLGAAAGHAAVEQSVVRVICVRK